MIKKILLLHLFFFNIFAKFAVQGKFAAQYQEYCLIKSE